MNIVQVIPSLSVGGAERVAALLALAQHRAGDQVSLVSLFDAEGSWIEDELRELGVPLRFQGKRPGLDLRVIPRLARTLRELAPDVIHTHLHVLKYVVAARRLARCRAPVVHTVHNMADREAEGFDLTLSRVAFRRSVVPVAIGDEVARSIGELYGVEPRWTVPNGIVVADFAPRPGVRQATREALGIGPDVPVLITAGRLNTQKNHAGMLQAFADPRLTEAGALLLIAGDGDLRADLEAQAATLSLGDRVRFLGVVANLPDLLAAADAFVLSSGWEGYPLVIMEAMAAGKPIVSTSVGCLSELVSPATGALVEPGDMQGLADALAALTADPVRARVMGEAGAAVAAERFDVSTMARAYHALYEAELAGGNRRRCCGLAGRRGASS
mgnify:CR=1 FL=1